MIVFALLVISFLIVRVFLRGRDDALRDSARIAFGIAFAIAGLTHFLTPTPFVQHIPEWVPARHSIVYASGALEMLGGIALASSKRHAQTLAVLIGLYLAGVFTVNIYVAVAGIDVQGQPDGIYAWIRLPFQVLYVWWLFASVGISRKDLARMSLRRLSVAIFAALALVACGPDSDPVNEAPSAGDSADIAVVIDDLTFETETITLHDDEEASIEIVNNDSVPHDFAIASAGLNTGTISPGESVMTTVEATESTREFVCTFHPEMRGRIEVV